MKLTSLLALLPVLSGVLASDVLDLGSDNFTDAIFETDLSLVEFFAPWCGHCKSLAPEYEEAATILKDKGIKLAKVDCTVHQQVCSTYGVQGYPTLKVFRNGVPTDYNGPRKADGIISYMNKQALPAVSILTAETVDEFTKADDTVIVAYGDAKHPVPAGFDDYANSARDSFVFGKFEGDNVPKLPAGAKLPAVVLYTKSGETIAFDGAADDTDKLTEWVKTYSLPVFGEVGPDNFQAYAEHGLPIAYLFIDEAEESARTKLIKGLEKVGAELRGKVNMVWIDSGKFGDYGKQLGLDVDKLPGFVIQNIENQTKYVLSEVATVAGMEKFVRGVIGGEIQPTIKSQEVPATQDENVWKLTSKGWDQLFGDNTKDVFVEFYAPWCGHCQRLAPIWDTLGEKYKNSNVVIAQMDATENDLPADVPFQLSGYPTLKFRPAGSDQFLEFNGDRSLESLVEYVEENSKSAAGEKRAEPTEAAKDDEDDEEVAHDEL